MSIQPDEERGLRLMLLVDEMAKVLRQRLLSNLCITPAAFDTTLNTNPIKHKLTQLHHRRKNPVLTKDQFKLLYPQAPGTADVNELDSTLLFALLTNIAPNHKGASDRSHIRKLRELRNKIIHRPLETPHTTFQQIWTDVCTQLLHLGAAPAALTTLQTTAIDNSQAISLQKLKRNLEKSQVVVGYGALVAISAFLIVVLSLYCNYNTLKTKYQRLLKAGEEGIWYGVPENTNNFILREGYANNITDTINNVAQNNTRLGFLLHGIGGVGKTELAIDFCRKHLNDFDGNVMWIDFESRSSADNSFRDLAIELQIDITDKTIDFIIQSIYQFLSNKKSLFVFDNVSPATDIASYLPKLSPKSFTPVILMTSQWDLLHLGDKFERKRVDVFDKETAEGFVRNQLLKFVSDIPLNNTDISSLVESVDGLPLALQQSVSFIIQHRLTIGKYLQQFKRDFGKLDVALNNRYEKTVLTTLKMSLESLSNTTLDCAPVAVDIMYISACLFSTKVSLQLLRNIDIKEAFDIDRAVNLLAQQSLIKQVRLGNDSYISLHNITRVGMRVLMKRNLTYFNYCKESVLMIERCSTHKDVLRMHYRYGDHWLVHLQEFMEVNEDLGTLMLLKPLFPIIIQAYDNKRQFESCSHFFRTLRRKVKSNETDARYLEAKTEFLKAIEPHLLFSLLAQNASEESINLCRDLHNSTQSNVHAPFHADGRFTTVSFFHLMDIFVDYERKRSEDQGRLSKLDWFDISVIYCKMYICKSRFELFSDIFGDIMTAINDEMILSVLRYHIGIAMYNKSSHLLQRSRELFHKCQNTYRSEKEEKSLEKEISRELLQKSRSEKKERTWEEGGITYRTVEGTWVEKSGEKSWDVTLYSKPVRDRALELLNEGLWSSSTGSEVPVNMFTLCGRWRIWVWLIWKDICHSAFDHVKRDLGIQENDYSLSYIFHLEAIRMFVELMSSETVEFGESQNQALSLKMVTAKISENEGNIKEAVKVLMEVLSTQKIELGDEHEETRNTKIRIANLLEKAGDKKAALKLLNEVLISETNELGEDHMKTQNTKAKIAELVADDFFSDTFFLFILLCLVSSSLLLCGVVYVFFRYRQGRLVSLTLQYSKLLYE